MSLFKCCDDITDITEGLSGKELGSILYFRRASLFFSLLMSNRRNSLVSSFLIFQINMFEKPDKAIPWA